MLRFLFPIIPENMGSDHLQVQGGNPAVTGDSDSQEEFVLDLQIR